MEPTKPLLCDCGHPATPLLKNTRLETLGYAQDSKTGKTICYACCAELDKQTLREGDRWAGYLSEPSDFSGDYVSNWPGSLKIPVHHKKTSRLGGFAHGYSGRHTRTDIWFCFEGSWWYGRNQGDNQIVRCKKLKRRPNL